MKVATESIWMSKNHKPGQQSVHKSWQKLALAKDCTT
jgi:hypothetical protein